MGGGLGGWVSGLFGTDNQETFHMDPTKVDPNAYQWGGQAGGAAADAAKYGQMGADAQNRQGVQLGTGQINQSRDQQAQALEMQRQAALGQAPSVAALQQKSGLESAMLAQQSMASSARGPAALASAQYQASANAGAQQQAAVNQAAQLRAGEMAQAREAYMGGASGMRGQDFQQSATQAQLMAQQRAQNDQMQLGMTGYQFGVNNAQLQAQGRGQAQQGENDLGAQGLNLKAAQGADQSNQNNAMFGVGAAAAGAMMLSDENAKAGIAPEGGAFGYGMPEVGGVSRSTNALDAPPSMAPYMGLMSMNTQALGYGGGGGPRPPGPESPTAMPAASSADAHKDKALADIIGGGGGAGGGGGTDYLQQGMTAGKAVGGLLGSLSDARAKQDARLEGEAIGVRRGLEAARHGGPPGFMGLNAAMPYGERDRAIAPFDTGRRAANPDEVDLELEDWQRKAPPHGLGSVLSGLHGDDPRAAAPAQMLDRLQPVSYNYRPGVGEDPNRRQYGVIAQDLAQTPMGASALLRRPDGLLAIDDGKGLGVALGGIANVHQRVRALEAKDPADLTSAIARKKRGG